MALGVSYLPKEEEEECYGVGLGLLLLVDVLLIDTVDDNAYCLVDGMEDWSVSISASYIIIGGDVGGAELWWTIATTVCNTTHVLSWDHWLKDAGGGLMNIEEKEMEFITPIDRS